MEGTQRSAARFIAGNYDKAACVTGILNDLNIPLLSERRKENRLLLMYRLNSGLTLNGSVINSLLPPDHFGRKNHPKKLKLIQTECNYRRYSFLPRTVFDWTSLPASVVTANSLMQFRNFIVG